MSDELQKIFPKISLHKFSRRNCDILQLSDPRALRLDGEREFQNL
jgi:hypothetical protein